jgi:N-acetylmuramoyl-L-alanine amidase
MIRARSLILTFVAGFWLCLLVFTQPTLRAADPLRSFDTVVIDAGHGGQDRGGIPGNYVTEKIVNLDVSMRLQQKLRKAGLRTVMTRSTDVFIPLAGRVAAANYYPRAIFVSVHFNSAPNANARGIETYFYSSRSYPLAAAIHRRVIGIAAQNRGLRQRGYYVLRNSRAPAVLVECGFLTNREDGRLALNANYRDRLASEIASGILAAKRGSY